MTSHDYHVEHYLTEAGKCPFTEWLNGLRDKTTINRICAGIARVSLGSFGITEPVGEGGKRTKT